MLSICSEINVLIFPYRKGRGGGGERIREDEGRGKRMRYILQRSYVNGDKL